MYVLPAPPITHGTGQLLDPNLVNQNMMYLVRAANDCFEKRLSHSVMVLPYQVDCVSGYNASDAQEKRRWRFTPPETTWIEAMYLDGYVAGTATMNVYNLSTGGGDAAGVTNPVMTFSGNDSGVFNQEIQLDGGTIYSFEAAGTSFNTTRLDLTLHLRSDRFFVSGADTSSTITINGLDEFTEASAQNADDFNANVTSLSNGITNNTSLTQALKPMFFQLHDFTTSTTVTTDFAIPVTDTADSQCKVVQMNVYALYASAGAAGATVIWTLKNAAGATQMTATCTMTGVTFATATATGTVSVESAVASCQSDFTRDFTLTVANNKATNCIKSYCYLYVK